MLKLKCSHRLYVVTCNCHRLGCRLDKRSFLCVTHDNLDTIFKGDRRKSEPELCGMFCILAKFDSCSPIAAVQGNV